MQRFRVLYAGASRAGRTTSLDWLSGARPDAGWHPRPNRLDSKEILLPSGETILLDAVVPYFGSAAIRSYEEATCDEQDWIREVARGVIEFLPSIDGVVFVAESWRHLIGRNTWSLKWVLRELAKAGLDADQLPFVFQINKRDLTDVLPFEQIAASLTTPRCRHVESVALVGHGVLSALDTLIRLVREGDSAAPEAPLGPVGSTSRSLPHSPQRLFETTTTPLTADGVFTDEIRTLTLDSVLVLGDSAIALAWEKEPVKATPLTPGEYHVDVAERLVTLHKAGGSRIFRRTVAAARVRLQNVTATSHELLVPGAWRYTTSVLVGTPEAINTLTLTDLPPYPDPRAPLPGARLLARCGSSFEQASRGEIAELHPGTDNEVQIWLGRDEHGRVVEMTCCGDEGAAMARRVAPGVR